MKRVNRMGPHLSGFSSGASPGGKVSHYRHKRNIHTQGAPDEGLRGVLGVAGNQSSAVNGALRSIATSSGVPPTGSLRLVDKFNASVGGKCYEDGCAIAARRDE